MAHIQYGLNNPSRYVDPSGHIACEVLGTENCDEEGNYTNEDVSGPTVSIDLFLWKISKRINEIWAGKNDLEGMARISDVASVFYDTFDKLLPFLTSQFEGISNTGPLNLALAAAFRAFTEVRGLPFSDKGFHPELQDKGNQVFHVWPYVIAGANGIDGLMIGYIGNYYHEILQPSQAGKSARDFALSLLGMKVGALIAYDWIKPAQLGDTLRYMFGPYGPGNMGIEDLNGMYPFP